MTQTPKVYHAVDPEEYSKLLDHVVTICYLLCTHCKYRGKQFAMDDVQSAEAFLKAGWHITEDGHQIFCPNCAKKLEE